MSDPFTLDLSEASGIAKKKSKMQHNQSSAYISPSTGLLEMSSADIDFLSDQHHQSSSRESRTNVIDQEGWHSKTSYHDTSYSSRNMIPIARDVAYLQLEHLKRSNHMTPDLDFFFL